VKVVKNKMAPPFREVEFDILYGQGISRAGDVIDLASELGVVEKSGAWFSFAGERIGQGRENVKAYLEQHPALLDKIESLVLAKYGIQRGGTPGSVLPAVLPAAVLSAVEAPKNGTSPEAKAKPAASAKP